MKGIELCSSPVVCHLCQVVTAGSLGSWELTDYYWIPDGLSVCRQHTCRSDEGGQKTSIYSTCSLITVMPVCLSASFPLLILLVHCGDHCSYLLHPPPHYSGFVKYFLVLFLQPEAISTFTSEPALISFAKFFCKTSEDNNFVSSDIEMDVHECSWSDFTVHS